MHLQIGISCHGEGVYDEPPLATVYFKMSSLIDLGVDNIITDHPDVLVSILEDRSQLSDLKFILLKFHNWLA